MKNSESPWKNLGSYEQQSTQMGTRLDPKGQGLRAGAEMAQGISSLFRGHFIDTSDLH